MNPTGFVAVSVFAVASSCAAADNLQFTYLWHLEQPLYWPEATSSSPLRLERAWQSIQRRDAGAAHPQNDLRLIFGLDDRVAAYQSRPRDSVGAISWSAEAGAQVSFSGGLIENIQSFAEAGGQLGYSGNWHGPWRESRNWMTTGGGIPARRMDIVQFSFHHALMPLLSQSTMRKEIALYKAIYPAAWGTGAQSVGFFPSEMAFSERMIPALAAEGIQWSFVSAEHVSRACPDFPIVYGSGGVQCDPPNRADQLNQNGVDYFRMSISRGCGPAEAYPFSLTPHRAQHVNPQTGAVSSVVVVPCSQSLGWIDGYNPIGVEHFQTLNQRNDPSRPMLVVLAHDGDNAWGGGFSYYLEATPNLVSQANGAGFSATVVQKYLSDHPVPASDVVHVEDGAWVNADGDFGAPQFLNWNWPPVQTNGSIDIANGWAEDIRNWAVITACQNAVDTAEQIQSGQGLPVRIEHVLNPQTSSRAAERAWHFFLGSLNSGYMYYGTSLDMEVKPTIACNDALGFANQAIGDGSQDQTGPAVWALQRHPWNPGAVNYGPHLGYQQVAFGTDCTVWTFVHDVSGTQSVTLKWRADVDGANPLASTQNETYAGGAEVGEWQSMAMTFRDFPAGNVFGSGSIDFFEMPQQIADQYYATISGLTNTLVDYFVEATDARGNVTRSEIFHVWIDDGQGSGGGGAVAVVEPDPAIAGKLAEVTYNPAGRPLASAAAVKIHVGFDGWSAGSAFDIAMSWNATTSRWVGSVPISASAVQFDFVFNNGAGVWDNNGGADWHVAVVGGQPTDVWVMDGVADSDAMVVAAVGTRSLLAGVRGDTLYVAAPDAGEGSDVFLFVADAPGVLRVPPWGKAGQAAAWDLVLADENDNAYEGWFDATGSQVNVPPGAQAITGANGGVVEGTVSLTALFGAVPETIVFACAPFGSPNGGVLSPALQIPAANPADGNLQASEYSVVRTCTLRVRVGGDADLDGDGVVGGNDLGALLGAWGTGDSCSDVNRDGTIDGQDLAAMLSAWG